MSIGEYDEKHEWPELAEWPELMPNEVSADFVDRTFSLVLEDQARINEEAAQVEDIQFPEEFLAAYATPDPSADFTGQLMSRMNQADRSALASYSVPEPSADFVERNLELVSELLDELFVLAADCVASCLENEGMQTCLLRRFSFECRHRLSELLCSRFRDTVLPFVFDHGLCCVRSIATIPFGRPFLSC